MADDSGIIQAEQRVREMNRMSRQYSEQGNRFLQDMREAQPRRQTRQVRFEPAAEPAAVPQSGQGGADVRQGSPARGEAANARPSAGARGNGVHNREQQAFPDISIDTEKLMILILIYLLMRERADIKLLLALGYLIL